MNRGDLTNAEWERLAPLLPPQKPAVGRPAHDHRRILNGMFWVLRTGAPWRDLPEEKYGKWETVASRFYRWVAAGIFSRVLAELLREADRAGELDWAKHYLDATVVRAHQHAAGARGTPEKGGGGGSAWKRPGRVFNQAPPAGGGRRTPSVHCPDGRRAP
jgi:transposase